MPICPLCDDSGLMNADATNPNFCYCAAGKQAKRHWEASRSPGKASPPSFSPPSFIDISQLEQVNANVDAMRASLLGPSSPEASTTSKHAVVQLLYRVAHSGHEVSMVEAAQLHDLAKTLESFFGDLSLIARKKN